MIRVLHVIPAIAPEFGGPSTFIRSLCHEWDVDDVELTVATTDARIHDGAGRAGALDFGRCELRVFRAAPALLFKYSSDLRHYLSQNVGRFDVVHVHAIWDDPSVAAAHYAVRQGKPLIVRPLGSLTPWAFQRSRVVKRLVFALLWRRILTEATLHCISELELHSVGKSIRYAGRAVVVGAGVDAAFFRVERGDRRQGILFIGRLHPVKRLDVLIEACAMAQKALGRSVRLTLAGNGEPAYVSELARLGTSCGVDLAFVGWQGPGDCINLLEHATVVALISQQENFGLAAAEAMAAGVPVIVTDTVGLSSDVRRSEGGWSVDPTGVAIAAAIFEALQYPDLARARGEKARAYAEANFRWSAITRRLASLYRELAGVSASRFSGSAWVGGRIATTNGRSEQLEN